MLFLRSIFIFSLARAISGAFFSLNYYSGANKNVELANADFLFAASPSAAQVADIYSRIGGLPPLLWEGN
jgi:hypothetical protein